MKIPLTTLPLALATILTLCVSMLSCQAPARTGVDSPPQVQIVTTLTGLGIAVYRSELQKLFLYQIGDDATVKQCTSWRLADARRGLVLEKCEEQNG